MKRLIRKTTEVKGSGHFVAAPSALKFIHTGCTLLDLTLGGGWPLGRIANIIGDKSTGKSLLAIEATANFVRQYPHGRVWYREAEAAFDKPYAASLGMPIDKVKFWPKTKDSFETVEQFSTDLDTQCGWLQERKVPGLYILDSLDALSDRKELERESGEATYGTDKARQMSQLFRKRVRKIEAANMSLIIISQVRDKIGISFGRKTTRSGGKALDFYSSQTLYLSHLKTLNKTKSGQKRAVGVRIRAKCDKNKISWPFCECEFTIRFGYGVEDAKASLEFLKETGKLKSALGVRDIETALASYEALEDDARKMELDKLKDAVNKVWFDIERSFRPLRPKYA